MRDLDKELSPHRVKELLNESKRNTNPTPLERLTGLKRNRSVVQAPLQESTDDE